MKKFNHLLVSVLLVLFTSSALADKHDWRDPNSKFSTNANRTNTLQITWRYSSDVQKDCEAESTKRHLGGFGTPMQACSFWNANSCTIITSTNPTMHTLGHEVRHCFQGNYH